VSIQYDPRPFDHAAVFHCIFVGYLAAIAAEPVVAEAAIQAALQNIFLPFLHFDDAPTERKLWLGPPYRSSRVSIGALFVAASAFVANASQLALVLVCQSTASFGSHYQPNFSAASSIAISALSM
jgi:hypothetical protein